MQRSSIYSKLTRRYLHEIPRKRALFSLPVEVINMILHEAVTQLVDDMKSLALPISILRDYRSLLLTCKHFRSYLYNASPRYAMSYTINLEPSDDEYHVPRIWQVASNTPNCPNAPNFRIATSYTEIFQVYQKLSIRYADMNFWQTPILDDKQGKYWLNALIEMVDLAHIFTFDAPGSTVAGLLLLLGPILLLHKARTPTHLKHWVRSIKVDEWISEAKKDLRYIFGEVVHVMKPRWDELCRYSCSVKDWSAPHDSGLTSGVVAPEVLEWWVWRGCSEGSDCDGFVSGYIGDKAWVFQMNEARLYTNFEPVERVGEFEFVEMAFRYRWFWVSRWPRPPQDTPWTDVDCNL